MTNMFQMTMERVRRETYNEFCEKYVNNNRLYNDVRTKFVGNELYGTVTMYSTRAEFKDSFNEALKIFMELFYQQR